MPFELSKEIAKNINGENPTQTYLASPDGNSFFFGRLICWEHSTQTKVVKLNNSNGEEIGNAQLRALAFQLVFDSRKMRDEVKRCEHLSKKLQKMLPNHFPTICVWPANVTESPEVYGTTKGHALYMEPELGSHVFIVLT